MYSKCDLFCELEKQMCQNQKIVPAGYSRDNVYPKKADEKNNFELAFELQ